MMSDLGVAAFCAACPVLAGLVAIGRWKSSAIRARTGEDVMRVGIVAPPRDNLALFGEGCLHAQIVAGAVQVLDTLCNLHPPNIKPGALANAIL